ncbi:MAG: hypothetical protein V3W22_01325 [Thermoplasmata archaeon]
MRGSLTLMMAAGGFVLMAVSFFLFAAPWGFPPIGVQFSDPRVPFAPTFFILGVVIIFLAPVLYEIWPEKRNG